MGTAPPGRQLRLAAQGLDIYDRAAEADRDIPTPSRRDNVARLWGLYTCGSGTIGVVEQIGPWAARSYTTRPGARFRVADALAHVRGWRRYAIHAPGRIRVSTFDFDGAEWRPSYDERVALGLGYLEEVLGVVPAMQGSPREGDHVSWLWPGLVPRDRIHEALSADLRGYFADHGVGWRHVEVRPTGQALRFPCGARQLVKDPRTLEPIPGTYQDTKRGRQRVIDRQVEVYLDNLERAVVAPARLDALLKRHHAVSMVVPRTLPRVEPSASVGGSERHALKGEEWRAELAHIEPGIPEAGTRNTRLGRKVWEIYVARGWGREDARSAVLAWLRRGTHRSYSKDLIAESTPEIERWLDRYERAWKAGQIYRGPLGYMSETAPDNTPRLSSMALVAPSLVTWTDPRWAEETTALLGWLIDQGRSRVHLGFEALRRVSATLTDGKVRRSYIGTRKCHHAVLAREALRRVGVLRKLAGHSADRHLTPQWDVDLRRASRLWAELQTTSTPEHIEAPTSNDSHDLPRTDIQRLFSPPRGVAESVAMFERDPRCDRTKKTKNLSPRAPDIQVSKTFPSQHSGIVPRPPCVIAPVNHASTTKRGPPEPERVPKTQQTAPPADSPIRILTPESRPTSQIVPAPVLVSGTEHGRAPRVWVPPRGEPHADEAPPTPSAPLAPISHEVAPEPVRAPSHERADEPSTRKMRGSALSDPESEEIGLSVGRPEPPGPVVDLGRRVSLAPDIEALLDELPKSLRERVRATWFAWEDRESEGGL